MKKHFLIDHLDPMGQGVFKDGEHVYFIPKTLPLESGTFQVDESKRGVHFGTLNELLSQSEERIKPECSHFNTCPGCQYLHTDYSNEINYKKMSLLRHLKKWGDFTDLFEFVPAENRLEYRNRVQLHYNLSKNLLGLYDSRQKKIVQILGCKLMVPELHSTFVQLHTNWQQKAQKYGKNEGHVELYWNNEQVFELWNKPYADGTFTQVNQLMNVKLKSRVAELITLKKPSHLLELFSGDGNLSKDLNIPTSAFDYFSTQPNEVDTIIFNSIDLYSEGALPFVQKKWNKNTTPMLLIDPPRTGFKNLSEWCEKLKVEQLLYVSCNPATLARDLELLKKDFSIKRVILIDLFPGTAHFETVMLFERTALI